MRKVIATIFMCLMFQGAWAIDIHDAKDQGLVGEANTGFVAAVRTPASAEVEALISKVNSERRSLFESAATKTGATVQQVSFRFYQLAIQKTRSGHYYQDESGNWVKK